LEQDLAAEEVMRRLKKVLPAGLRILAAVPVLKRKESLMALINLARYRVEISLPPGFKQEGLRQENIEILLNKVLSRSACLVLRQGKKGEREVDIRPGLYRLAGYLEEDNSQHDKSKLIIEMDVQTGSSGNVRPEEVLQILKAESSFSWGENIRIHRLGLYIREDEKIWSPLERS